MKQTDRARDLHTKAARNHEEAAQLHRQAAECHDQNRIVAARQSAKSAMDCCQTAQLHSIAACDCSDNHPTHDSLRHNVPTLLKPFMG